MKLLIVVATEAEIFPFFSSVSAKINNNLYSFTYKNIIADILVTGPGMIPSCYHLTNILSSNNYDLALNIGLAGSFKKELSNGTLVNVVSDRFSEMGAEDGTVFLTLTDINLPFDEVFPFKNGWLKPEQTLSLPTLLPVKGITVNTVHGNDNTIAEIKKIFDPDIETMEGASFFYCCMMKKLPCFQIRAISNFVEKRNKNNWDIPSAIENLNNYLPILLSNLKIN